ncbi:MAG: cytoplasmic protein, partial [Chitinophagaceae bacterium]|nr:cytoplasmic protein [Chitinophagaceae bacterium]
MAALSENIHAANTYFLNKAQKQVNTALTFRNWLIGYYIVEYEQSGKDRAEYG